mgnify:CR=1 FL=1
MINKQEFAKIRKEIGNFDKKREELIQLSREIINLSKRVIYSLHRNDMKAASNYVKNIDNKRGIKTKNIVLFFTKKLSRSFRVNLGCNKLRKLVHIGGIAFFIPIIR